MPERTWWNGEPADARKVTITVADAPEFPLYWGRGLVGARRKAVEVDYGVQHFFLDDEPFEEWEDPECSPGWEKVTVGRGSPRLGHRNLNAVPGSVQARED